MGRDSSMRPWGANDAPDEADQAFERFRDGGDPDDLALTFEHTAAGLLRLARQLARGDEAHAEDLVQSTFLGAIEHRQRFLTNASVRAWLSGILANKAKEAARQGHRVLDADRLPDRWTEPDPNAVPDRAAEHAELDEALDRAIDSMPARYQEILTPYLRQGAAAGQIASVLGRPPGSVRTQLVRGLEQLRAKLPAGLTGVFVARLTPGRGIDAVRGDVLEAARSGFVAAPTAASGVALLGSHSVWLAVVIGLSGLVWIAWSAPNTEAELSTGAVAVPPTPAAPAAGEVSSPTAGRSTEAADARRIEVPAGARRLVFGRVRSEHGEPVASAEVMAWRGHAYPLRVQGGFGNEFDTPPLARTRTDRDGAFTLDCSDGDADLPLELTAFDGDRHAILRAKIRASAAFPVRGAELVLRRTTVWSGRLLDAQGRPLAGQVIGTRCTITDSESDRTPVEGLLRREPDDVQTETGPDGSFALRWFAGRATTWQVRHPLHRLWLHTHAPEDGPAQIRLEPGHVVAGVVARADGSPASGAEVRLGGEAAGVTQCGPDGRFRVHTPELSKYTYLLVDDPRSAIHALQPLPNDAAAIRITLERSRVVRGRVVDGDQRPVAGARVTILGPRRVQPPYGFGGQPSWVWAHGMQQSQTAEDGSFAFDRLYPAVFEVRAHPPGDALRFVSAKVRSGDRPMTIELSEKRLQKVTLTGTVVDAHTGQPVPDVALSLWRKTDHIAVATPIESVQPDGRFSVTGIEPGLIAIGAKAPGCAEYLSPFLHRGLGAHSIDVRLFGSQRAAFTVRDPDGHPCPGVELAFRGPDGTELWIEQVNRKVDTLTTDPAGRIFARGLPATVVTVEARHPPLIPRTYSVDLRAAGSEPIPLAFDHLPPVLRMRVSVFEHAPSVDPDTLPARLDAKSRVELQELLAEGAIQVPSRAVTIHVNTMSSGEPTGGGRRLDWNRLCSGRLTPSARPVQPSTTTDAEARFRAHGLYGRYSTGVEAEDSPGPTATIRVIPAELELVVEQGSRVGRRTVDARSWGGSHHRVLVYLPRAEDG